ncbi:SDR family oxidoreductase [Nitrosopumilus sp.]|uniref:SDR family oxidoreductase n=1 Tax=Nitrosopumilus sp. TaxID=2024843 RepID=UPI002624FBA3|nr:SDR family oxidoreductase [Nitrosopumilus sp.]
MIKDKVVIITGASSGIGYAAAETLSKAGAKVAIGARRTDRLEELAKKISDDGGEVFYQKLDVTQRSECDNFAKAVLEKWGSIDILVNNAGLMPLSYFKNLKVDEWDRMVDVNLKGVLYCTSAVITHMNEKKSGHIVNVSSTAGRIVFPGGIVYCATKHAVTAFSEGLRQEFSVRSNIRVTSIEPGIVETELTDTITDESIKDYVENARKIDGLQSQDVANAILYAVNAPPHVNVNEILMRPTQQEH